MTEPTPPTAQAGVSTCYRHPDREAYIRCQRCDRFICPDCMRPAAVGFQCPECVKEGAKTTRSGRTAYGGLRPSDASITSGVLIALNVAVWIAVRATGGFSSQLLEWLVLRPQSLCDLPGPGAEEVSRSVCEQAGGTYLPGVADGAYWQLLTSMFTHEQIWHIGFNMLALWVLGPQLELAIGRLRFLALYFISGFAGAAMVIWFGPQYSGTLGASGAIFGLMGALAVVAFKVGGDVRGILTWIGINLVLTFAIANISWQGHLGGLIAGTAVGAALVYAPRGSRRTALQAAGTAAVALVVVVATLARILTLS
jgi:membrane associated rhomboid family serine protease